jgi:hypothetical protein
MLRNTTTIDLITEARSGEWWELIIIAEANEWDASGAKEALVEKLNNYLLYVTKGHLSTAYPTTKGLEARIVLQSVDPLPNWATTLLAKTAPVALRHNVKLQILPL